MPADVAQAMLQEEEKKEESETFDAIPSVLSMIEEREREAAVESNESEESSPEPEEAFFSRIVNKHLLKETTTCLPLHSPLFHVNRVCLRTRVFVLFPNLYRFISLTGDEACSRQIERTCEDPCLAVQRSRLHDRALFLEAVPSLPVAESEHSIVAAGKKNALLVHGNRVQNVVVSADVPQELRLLITSHTLTHVGTLPLLDVVRGSGGKHILPTSHRTLAPTPGGTGTTGHLSCDESGPTSSFRSPNPRFAQWHQQTQSPPAALPPGWRRSALCLDGLPTPSPPPSCECPRRDRHCLFLR